MLKLALADFSDITRVYTGKLNDLTQLKLDICDPVVPPFFHIS